MFTYSKTELKNYNHIMERINSICVKYQKVKKLMDLLSKTTVKDRKDLNKEDSYAETIVEVNISDHITHREFVHDLKCIEEDKKVIDRYFYG